MNYEEKVRISKKFRDLIDYIRARRILLGYKSLSIKEITEVIADNVDKEKLFQNINETIKK
jgi:adenine-specific DNA methylase